MKHLSLQTIFALCISMLIFSSCSKELDNYEPAESGDLQLKSVTGSKDFMIITNSESLPDGFIVKLEEYGKVIRTIPEIGVAVVRTSNKNFEKKVSKISDVKCVVPDLKAKWIEDPKVIKKASIGSDETYFGYQWGLDAIDAPEAWDAGYTGKGAKVFILDGGIDPTHPDLSSNLNITLSTSFVDGETYIDSTDGHGTHVAGIIAAADNQFGVIGVAPEAEIVMVKVLSSETGSGSFSGINNGIVYAALNGADVINMSLGATLNKNGFYLDDNDELQKVPAIYIQNLILAQKRAVDFAVKQGALVVSSAGNNYMNADGNRSLFVIPADFAKVVSVSATAPESWIDQVLANANPFLDYPASYSNTGKSLVDIAAPGGDFDSESEYWYYDMILSTTPGGFSWMAGTSMASPVVAGVAALLVEKYNGNITPEEITMKLYKTADHIETNGNSTYFGNGRVNAYRAVTE